ncbi:putative proline racemase [Cadophora sp. MPI-SDFR-AT-0126]|nr:putative proline racemase [Leotiomycetes sp. MPI-SDFR-AT-0126]
MNFPIDLEGHPQMIHCVEMHTTGEPTRIIYKGFPDLSGALLEQRASAKRSHDNIRQQLMLEPRGHWDMYGAVLRPDTELVASGQAHIGVLFMHNEGFSTMCGHATIALGRFLVDTHDLSIFPKRDDLVYDEVEKATTINLHAPCGVVKITVPTKENGYRSDSTRQVSFVSVPSFAAGIQINVPIPKNLRWPQLDTRTSLIADISYGGTFYCIVPATELGFRSALAKVDMAAMNNSTLSLKEAINSNSELQKYLRHPDSDELGFLYSVMAVDTSIGLAAENTVGVETGLCFFADQQVDRSPTGGAVASRVALAHAKGLRKIGERWTYHSLVSNGFDGCGAFVGSVVEELEQPKVDGGSQACVRVKVEGNAYYTGFHCFIVEDADRVGAKGFSMKGLTK